MAMEPSWQKLFRFEVSSRAEVGKREESQANRCKMKCIFIRYSCFRMGMYVYSI
jgi:hypothetical protein